MDSQRFTVHDSTHFISRTHSFTICFVDDNYDQFFHRTSTPERVYERSSGDSRELNPHDAAKYEGNVS